MASPSSPNQTIYLITGAGRSLGFHMSKVILSRPDVLLIAFVRDPSNQADLDSIVPGPNSSLLKIAYDASDATSASTAISTLQSAHQITHLDVVIANAGILSFMGPSMQATPDFFLKEFTINTLGPITLFQACHPLLLNSLHTANHQHHTTPPKFFAISSRISSTSDIRNNPQVSALPYGVAKCGLNHAMVKFHVDNPDLIVGLLTPGRTKTQFSRDTVRVGGARNTAAALSFHEAWESAEGLVKRVDGATREGDSGRFFDWDEGEIAW